MTPNRMILNLTLDDLDAIRAALSNSVRTLPEPASTRFRHTLDRVRYSTCEQTIDEFRASAIEPEEKE